METGSLRWLCHSFVLIAVAGIVGCKPVSPSADPKPATPQVLSEAALAILATADAHDGKLDHIVEDCAACRLHMKGKGSIKATLNEYTLHLCSEGCRQAVEKDPEGVLSLIGKD